MKSRGRRFAAFAMVLAALVAVIGLAPRAALAAEGDVAKIGDDTYPTLNEAIANVEDGETIELVADVTNATGISVPSGSNFTVDFGGHTYTLTGPGAGSTGTETQGFQLLKDSTIVFRNGTINIAPNANNIKRIINSYCDLTLENMTFDAKNQVGGEDYALSFNNGSVTFSGDTNILMTDPDAIAFDVCLGWSPAYKSVDVAFDNTYTGEIQGMISYDSPDLENAKLAIAGNGTFNGIELSAATAGVEGAPSIVISGGTFSQAPDQAYLADGFTVFENADGSVSAVPEEDIFTVTFVDGEKKAAVEVVDGTAVTAQPITEQPGYKVYWALDGKEFDFATPVTGDITLTAAKTLLPPTLTVESDSPAIVGDKVTISVAAESDAKVTYTYKWYGNGQLLNETSDTLSASAEGSYYVEVTATDADGQTATAQSNPVYVYFDGQVMYRLYNPYNGEHLYTADTLERDVLDNIGWNYEGIGWIAPVYDASTPVYRLNNPFAPLGDHHYTTSLVEYEACIEAGWEGEGIAWYSADEEAGVPIYRQYNPFASSGTHNYTADENERDTLVDLGWKDEDVAWYALK